jgi:hypothetical protein
VRHASRFSGLLRVEASLARTSQSVLKTDGGATTSDAHDTIAEVASETCGRRAGRCDELHRILLPFICRF